MSAELAIANQLKPYGMRVIKDENFDAETMIDVTDDVAQYSPNTTETLDFFETGNCYSAWAFNNQSFINLDGGQLGGGGSINYPLTDGVFESAVQFAGTSGAFLRPVSGNTILSVNNHTISLWIKVPVLTTRQRILSSGVYGDSDTPSSNAQEFRLETTGELTMFTETGSGVNYNSSTGVFVPVNTWTNIIISIENATLKTYLNGVLTSTVTDFVPSTGSGSFLTFGRIFKQPNDGNNAEFALDQVRLFNTVLTDEQALFLYENETLEGYKLTIPDNSKIVIPYYKA